MPLATMPSSPTSSEQLNPTAERALDWAERWYPTAELALTGVSEAEATVIVQVDGDIRFLKYENLDADVPRCDFCGRPL